MAKIVIVLCLVGLVGCASHLDQRSFKTPSQEGFRRCTETANGSTSCVEDYEDKGGGYGYGGYGMPSGMPYSGGRHPLRRLLDQPESTAGERAMERVPGGQGYYPIVQADPCVDEDCPTLAEDVEQVSDLAVATDKDVESLKKDVDRLKKNSKKEEER